MTLSYTAVLKLINDISERHRAPIERWMQEGASFKFVGDNVDKKKGVRDISRSDHGELKHMYSLLAVKARVQPPPSVSHFVPPDISSHPVSHFLPTEADLLTINSNLVVLVSPVLCKYIKVLKLYKRSLVKHIPHSHSLEMACKSEIAVLDVLHKNETRSVDMVDIMREQQSYLGEGCTHTVLSDGDHVTCERQQGSKRHVMDSDTRTGRLELLEPCVEDWHCLLSILGVCLCTKT